MPAAPDALASEPGSVSALARGARLLARGTAGRAEIASVLSLLQHAPSHPTWNRALLEGLSHEDPQVRADSLEACLARLDGFGGTDALAHAMFFDELLACCLRRSVQHGEEVQEHLLRSLVARLEEAPSVAAEHLYSRFLARTRGVLHVALPAPLVREVVRTQWHLAAGAGRSAQAALALYQHRRHVAYSTPGVTSEALQAYLDQDRRLPARHVDGTLFEDYGRLFAAHARAGNEAGVRRALANMDRWLADLPHTAEQRSAATPDLVRARRNKAWNDLDRDVMLHLAAHAALVPGPDHPHDLVRLLHTRYVHPQGEPVLLAGLQVLTHLPGLRARLPELLLLLEAVRPNRSPAAGEAVLRLLDELLVGLPEAAPEAERDDIGDVAAHDNRLSQERARVLRRNLLLPDQGVHRALEALTRDERVAPEVRACAWKVLVRFELPGVDHHLREALSSPDRAFFVSALEVAAATRHRAAGRVLADHWDRLVAGDAATPGRRARLERLCATVAVLRPAALLHQPGATPPLLALALGDPDSEVRHAAIRAVHQAGHAATLEREHQRRALERLHDRATQQTNEANRLEESLSEQAGELLQHQIQRDDLVHEMQRVMRERETLLAESWTSTIRLEGALYDVQAHLAEVLSDAEAHEARLRELKEHLKRRQDQDRAAHPSLETVLRQRKQLLQEIEARQQQAAEADASADDARRRLAALQTATAPEGADADERRRHHAAWMQQAETLRETVARHRAAADAQRGRVLALTQEVERLVAASDEARAREQDVDALREEVAVKEQQGEEVQRQLARLEAHVRDLRQQDEAAHAARTQQMEETTRRLSAYQGRLADLDGRLQELRQALAATRTALMQCHTEVQQSLQDLEDGRQQYAVLSERSVEESLEAERQGAEAARHAGEQRRREQESLLWYAYNIEQALARRPEPMQE